ncbi:hypothetical protein LTR09_003924 [Extremus antarcticus]|uniref:G-patch domain-containing protein n=1 Tax=Extremus antarcticus TaxID=702011 RepID=A0AAJ0DRL6_9PEZI|nr:hypothetical protein LTR09_003924 [Extremus antarcticus]
MRTSAVAASSPERQQHHGQQPSSTPSQQPPGLQKSNFEDWVGDGDDDFFYQDNRARGGRNKKKKKNNKPQERMWDWDDIYDPTLPNNYADYKGSEEQHREIRDWKARLYHHQMKEAKKAEKIGGKENARAEQRPKSNMMFAPPSNLNFAPPSFDDAPAQTAGDDDDDYYPPPVDAQQSDRLYEPLASFAQPPAPNDATADDVYMPRMQMGGTMPTQTAPPIVEQQPVPQSSDADLAAKRAEAQAKIAAFKAKLVQKTKAKQDVVSASPVPPPPPPPPEVEPHVGVAASQPAPSTSETSQPQTSSTISRAPVRYEVPPPPPDLPPSNEDVDMADAETSQPPTEDQPRSSRPGQKGFAERLLKKYGWEKGHGLGASGDGITTAIVAKAEKRKKRSDAQGGGWVAPANMGKIVGGKKRKVENSADDDVADARFGPMSSVVKLSSMLDGMDVQHEIEENNIMQEIGDEMGGQYGNVERVFIWREAMGGGNEVFVKFTSQLSALRAVNAMSGTEFAGNEVQAQFWDEEKWGKEEYA